MASLLHGISVVALPILVAITFHEAAHGFVANRLGDPTAKYLGRLTLNPLVHIDPFGTVLLPLMLYAGPLLVGGQPGPVFGYAKPVPVNFMNLRRPKSDMVWVAAAGPLTNLALAIASGLLFRAVVPFAVPDFGMAPDGGAGATGLQILEPVTQMLLYSVAINVFLMVFNLLPVPPLDGGRVLVGLLPEPGSGRVAALEPYGLMIVLALIFLDPTNTVRRVLGAAHSALLSIILWV